MNPGIVLTTRGDFLCGKTMRIFSKTRVRFANLFNIVSIPESLL